MNVCWTEAALADLRAVEAYIARHSEQYAHAMVERILDRTELLTSQPRLGPVVPEYEDETLRELFVEPYRIVYRLLEDQVDIVTVVLGRDGCLVSLEPDRISPFRP
ncbi:MAG: type II toxin-antitoxin system RelE/ParE family toxin [Isosphaeraceae bacterium]